FCNYWRCLETSKSKITGGQLRIRGDVKLKLKIYDPQGDLTERSARSQTCRLVYKQKSGSLPLGKCPILIAGLLLLTCWWYLSFPFSHIEIPVAPSVL